MIDLVRANEFTFTPSAFLAAYIEQEDKTVVTDATVNSGSLDTSPKTIGNLNGSKETFAVPLKYQDFNGNMNITASFGSVTLSTPVDVDTFNLYTSPTAAKLAPLVPQGVTLPTDKFSEMNANRIFVVPTTFFYQPEDNMTAVGPGPYDDGTLGTAATSAQRPIDGALATDPQFDRRTGLLSQNDYEVPAVTASGSLVDVVGQIIVDTRTVTKTTTTTKGAANTVVLVLSYGTFRAKCANAAATVELIYNSVAQYLNSL